jgi:hypothetical protein
VHADDHLGIFPDVGIFPDKSPPCPRFCRHLPAFARHRPPAGGLRKMPAFVALALANEM